MTKLKTVFLRTPYNYDTNEAGDESGLSCPEPTLAQQHMKEECDINVILRKFNITGELPVIDVLAEYGDFSGFGDYHALMNEIKHADEAFNALPIDLRSRFNHDPAQLVEFCNNDSNRDEAIKLGLIDAPIAQVVVSKEETPKSVD